MAAEVSASPTEPPATSPSTTAAPTPPAPEKPRDYNPRWKGYAYIGFCSLVNFASLVNVPNGARHSNSAAWAASVTFGVVTFGLAGLILLTDRFQLFIEIFHYTQAYSGNFEGCTLIFFTAWWIAGVGYTTRPGGLAYYSNNIYFSSWSSLASCLYTFNEWSTDKDFLSFQELTSLSATLRSWYVLCLSSLIVMGTAANLHGTVSPGQLRRQTSYGVAAGLLSTCLSVFFILVHYHCFGNSKTSILRNGAWLELGLVFFLILLWIITVAILTQVGGVGSTFSGTGCLERTLPSLGFSLDESNPDQCSLVVFGNDRTGRDDDSAIADATLTTSVTIPCATVVHREIPGSNLYLASWVCLAAALNITLRWKAAQALQFAHAAQAQTRQHLEDADDEEDNLNNSSRGGGVGSSHRRGRGASTNYENGDDDILEEDDDF